MRKLGVDAVESCLPSLPQHGFDLRLRIARAIRQAADDGAILLIDEVDTFLHDRRGVTHGWEATSVNEILTQMEAFEGVFIASTHLFDGFDQAALRRFDLKLRFGYLCADQTRMLWCRQARALGLPEALAESRASIGFVLWRRALNRVVLELPTDMVFDTTYYSGAAS